MSGTHESDPPAAGGTTAGRPPARPRVVDASMTLLNEVMYQPLDPGYLAAARRRASDARPPGPRAVSGLLVLLAAALSGVVVTVGVRELRRPEPELTSARRRLEQQISSHLSAAAALRAEVQKDRSTVSDLEARLLALQGSSALEQKVQALGTTVGARSMTGPGLRMTLTNAATTDDGGQLSPRDTTDTGDGVVLDKDLQIIVNSYWSAGAEAIAINGQRLTTLSAIRSAGEAILVDFTPLNPPYVLDIIGDPETLQTGFAETDGGGQAKSLASNYHIGVKIEARDSLTVPPAGALRLSHAKVHRAAADGTSPTSTSSPGAATSASPSAGGTS